MTVVGLRQRCSAVRAAYAEDDLAGLRAECHLLYQLIQWAVSPDPDVDGSTIAELFPVVLDELSDCLPYSGAAR